MIEHVNAEVAMLKTKVDSHQDRITRLEEVVIVGSSDNLPLAEVVRNLTTAVDSYIKAKNKEEQDRKEEWRKLKWVIIAFLVPLVATYVWQTIIMMFEVYPLLVQMTQN